MHITVLLGSWETIVVGYAVGVGVGLGLAKWLWEIAR